MMVHFQYKYNIALAHSAKNACKLSNTHGDNISDHYILLRPYTEVKTLHVL